MKLTKSDLFFIFDSVDALSEKGSYQAEELAEEAYSALYNDELEIEGYEKVDWVKFDPDNPDTFPPDGKVSIVATKDGQVGTSLVSWLNGWCGFTEYYQDEVTHWRPGPKPPVETE